MSFWGTKGTVIKFGIPSEILWPSFWSCLLVYECCLCLFTSYFQMNVTLGWDRAVSWILFIYLFIVWVQVDMTVYEEIERVVWVYYLDWSDTKRRQCVWNEVKEGQRIILRGRLFHVETTLWWKECFWMMFVMWEECWSCCECCLEICARLETENMASGEIWESP